jgi:hypothetical protein
MKTEKKVIRELNKEDYKNIYGGYYQIILVVIDGVPIRKLVIK